jgi:hypothetical protein
VLTERFWALDRLLTVDRFARPSRAELLLVTLRPSVFLLVVACGRALEVLRRSLVMDDLVLVERLAVALGCWELPRSRDTGWRLATDGCCAGLVEERREVVAVL